MNEIVERVMLRLNQREHHIYTLDLEALALGLSPELYLRYGSLNVWRPDLGFIVALSNGDVRHPAVTTVLEAWSYGVRLNICLPECFLTALPILRLERLPLTLTDCQGLSIYLHSQKVLAYSDVILLSDCWLLTERKTLVTPLAQEIMNKRHVRLIRQE